MGKDISNVQKLEAIKRLEQRMAIRKSIIIEDALEGDDPESIIKAAAEFNKIYARDETQRKAVLVDPYQFYSQLGYKDKPITMSYQTIKNLTRAIPVVNAIIRTRVNQVASFAEPQSDKYKTGFQIRKKIRYFSDQEDRKPNKQEQIRIDEITNFLLCCGENNSWEADDFDAFDRKTTRDSLLYDQMCFEPIFDKFKKLRKFVAVDASTCRIAGSYDDETYKERDKIKINGYYPSYVQVINGAVDAEFYPWELCFGIRNPITDIYANGYGLSEIEEMVSVITSLLWSDTYNSNFFKQGSNPKGFFKLKTPLNGFGIQSGNQNTMTSFRQQWLAAISGVTNAHKTPVVEGDFEWVPMHMNNKDMEFSQWQEYLIKLSTAIYCIDPAEINFPLSGSSEMKPVFEGGSEAKIKNSKDKGLVPILKFKQRKYNRFLISAYDKDYELVYGGVDSLDLETELRLDLQRLGGFSTINEVRKKWGFKPIEGGDVVANPMFLQNLLSMKQEAVLSQQSETAVEQQHASMRKKPDTDLKKAFDEFLETQTNN